MYGAAAAKILKGAFMPRMESLLRRAASAVAFAFLAGAAFSTTLPKKPSAPLPTEVKIISVPQTEPTEVKIVSTPPASPAEVKIISQPPDKSADAMVSLTRWLVIANAGLCLVTFGFGIKQSHDARKSIEVSAQAAAAASKSAEAAERSATVAGESIAVTERRERAATEREVSRAAHKVMATARRVEKVAHQAHQAGQSVLILRGHSPGGGRGAIDDKTRKERTDRTSEMTDNAKNVVVKGMATHSDEDLTDILRRLDEHQEQLDVMRDDVIDEFNKRETERLAILDQRTAMEAAAIAGRPPPKNTLG